MLKVRNLEAQAVVELTSVHHFLHLVGKLHQLRVLLISTNIVEQVVEDVTDHSNLLLVLSFIVLDADSGVALHPLHTLLFLSFQVKSDVGNGVTKLVEPTVHFSIIVAATSTLPIILVTVMWELLRRARVLCVILTIVLGVIGILLLPVSLILILILLSAVLLILILLPVPGLTAMGG